MLKGQKTLVAALAAALVTTGVAAGATFGSGHGGFMGMHRGSGMMGSSGGGYGGGMMGGYAPSGAVQGASVTDLNAVRYRINAWLHARRLTRLHVGEVMAFSNNYYVAIKDQKNKGAFELLTGPSGGWVMEEPPSMMWNTRYGMMGGYGGGMMGGYGGGMMGGWGGPSWAGSGRQVSNGPAAVHVADAWLARARPGEHAEEDAQAFPGYYTMDTKSKAVRTVGMLSVNARTGAVWYHTWHGRFLGERDY